MRINLSKILSFFILTTAIVMNTACAQSLSKEQKMEAINSLESYHTKTNGSLLKNSPKQKTKVPAFQCSSNTTESCASQELTYKNANTSNFPVFAEAGKYKVDIAFKNDIDLPKMYREDDHFIGMTRAESEPLIISAYENFLGYSYDQFSPEFLGAGKESLIINLYVSDANELEGFLDDDRVIGIWHIGNNEVIPEGR